MKKVCRRYERLAPRFDKSRWSLLAGLAAAFTAVVVDTLYQGPLTLLEEEIASAVDYRAFPQLTPLMLTVTYLGSTAFASVSTGLVAAALVLQRAYRPALMLMAAVYGGMLLNATLKQFFERARPVTEDPLLMLETYSFPSGHAAVATVLYGGMAVLAARRLSERWSRRLAIGVAVMLIMTIAASRVYLGVHHLTDVIAGVIEAVFWLLLCHTVAYGTRSRTTPR